MVTPPPSLPTIAEEALNATSCMSVLRSLTVTPEPFSPCPTPSFRCPAFPEDYQFSGNSPPQAITWFGDVSLEESVALSPRAPFPLPHGSYANNLPTSESLSLGCSRSLPIAGPLLGALLPNGVRVTPDTPYCVIRDAFNDYFQRVSFSHSMAAEYEKSSYISSSFQSRSLGHSSGSTTFTIRSIRHYGPRNRLRQSRLGAFSHRSPNFLNIVTPNSDLPGDDLSSHPLWETISTVYTATRDVIVNSILKALGGILQSFSTLNNLIVNLVNNILNFVTNITILSTQTLSGLLKTLLITNLVSTLSSFISNIHMLLARSGFNWDATAATSSAASVADFLAEKATQSGTILSPTPNGWDDIKNNISMLSPREWVTAVVASIVAILFAGLGLSKALSPKDLAAVGSTLRASKDVTTTTTSIAEFISTKIIGLDMDHDLPKCEAIEALVREGAALQELTPADFVQSSTDYHRLQTYVQSIVDVTSKPMEAGSSKRYQTARSLLITIYRNLTQKMDSVKAILATKPRQCTVGLVLSGPAGVGKSTFGKYFCQKVAEKLGYRPSIYNLNHPKDGFYENYGGQDFAEYNEWMALRSEDPLLKDLNSIFSTDPMNFEAAALDGKHQPCRVKFAFITSNTDSPELGRILNEGAVAAVWDRLYHVRVDDPLSRGRHQPADHRRPDFTHLKFRRVIHHGTNVTYRPLSLPTLLERMVGRVAAAEREYLLSLLTSTGSDNDLMNQPLSDATKAQLRQRLGVVEDITMTHTPYDDAITPNALGRDFFVIRLQGIPGSGKTTAAERIAREFSLLLGYPFQYSCTQEEFRPIKNKPMIYVLDDWVERSAYQQYLEQVNSTHRLSIFVIASNTVFSRYTNLTDFSWLRQRAVTKIGYWFAGFPYVPSPWAVPGDMNIPMGVLRRIGLPGYVRLPTGELFDCPHAYSLNFTFGEHFVMRDHYEQILNIDSLMELIFMRYKLYLSQPGDFTIVETAPPAIVAPLAEIHADSAADVITAMRTVGGIGQAYAGRNPKVSFKLDPIKAYAANTAPTIANAWMIVEPSTNDPAVMRSIFSRMCASFSRMAPDQSFILKIDDTATTYYYYRGVGYIYSEADTIQSMPIEFGDRHVDIRRPDEIVRISAHEFVAWRQFKQIGQSISKLTLAELRLLNHHFETLSTLPNAIPGFRVNVELVTAQQSREASPAWTAAKAAISKHPAFWLGCALIGIFCVGTGSVALFHLIDATRRWACKSKDTRNTNEYERAYGRTTRRGAHDRIDKMIRPPRDPAPRDRYAEEQYNAVAKKLDAEFRDHWISMAKRYGAVLADQPLLTFEEFIDRVLGEGESPTFALQNMINERPDQKQQILDHPVLGKITANMLSANDMIKQDETRLERQHRTLTKIYYKIVREDGGCCYAIALRHNLLLTVSHMFDCVGQPVTVISDGVSWPAKCKRLYRDRDLAVVEVTDKMFPSVQHTRHLFAPDELLHNASQGYFIRPGPNLQVMGGRVTYYDHVAYPLTCRDKNYDPREKFVVWTAVGCDSMRDFIKRGDCGFPLVVNDHSGCIKIIALHNAFNEREKAYFSGVCQTDWDEYARTSVTPNQDSDEESNSSSDEERPESDGKLYYVRVKDTKCAGYMPDVFADGLARGFTSSRWDHVTNKLDVLGYNGSLRFHSRPRNGHHLMDRDYLRTPLVVLPSAVDLTWVIDTSKLAHDMYDQPSPLFTQCLKYDKTVQWSYDKEIFHRAVAMVRDECLYYYGNFRVLRLHECVNGVFGEPLACLDPRTSAGPFMKHCYNIQNKVPLLKRVDNDTIIIDTSTLPGRQLRDQYYDYVKRLNDDHIGPLILSKDCAKVELLPAYKATEGKVRLFNEVDLAVNLVLRSYFGDFVNQAMKHCRSAPIRLGFNPYIDATHIMRQFNQIDGDVVSTDFSAFDKQLPPALIYAFTEIAASLTVITGKTPEEVRAIYQALYSTLTHVLHVTDGVVYTVDRGNESGTFVTTILNSISVWVLTYYTVIRKWYDLYHVYPTTKQVREETRQAILGDDRSFKASKFLPITTRDFIEDSKLFGLVCTQAKSGTQLDFCSRSFIWDEVEHVCWPPLKNTSILGQVRWYASLTPQQVLDNVTNALYEASLHPTPVLYNLIRRDAELLLREYGFELQDVRLHSREYIREKFIATIRMDGENPLSRDQSTYEEETPAQFIDKHKRSYTRRFLKPVTSEINPLVEVSPKELFTPLDFLALITDLKMNPKGALFELLQTKQVTIRPVEHIEESRDDKNKPHFIHKLSFLGHTTEGSGYSKAAARDSAYASLLSIIHDHAFDTPNVSDLPDRANKAADRNGKPFLYRSVMEHLKRATELATALTLPVIVLHSKSLTPVLRTEMLSSTRYQVDEMGNIYCLSATSQYFNYKDMSAIYLMQPGTSDSSERILVGASDTVPNMDQPVTPSEIEGTRSNPGITTIPALANPITTRVLPAQASNEPSAVGALEPLIPHEDLNPTGAPNMLGVGAIEFDLKDLVYSQFIDSDTQYTFTDDSAQGTIIFQIPYDPTSQFVNPYIRQYVSLHERYAGALLFRVTIVGNATFSGIVGMAWQPKAIAGTVAKISELHKYSYFGKNITLPDNEVMVLHDARKQFFYRETADADVASRPHLVCYVHMTAVSPLREGITIRIRIASKLATAADGVSPFQVALPTLPAGGGTASFNYVGPKFDVSSLLTGQPVYPIVVRSFYDTERTFFAAIDGNIFPTYVLPNARSDYFTTKWQNGGSSSLIFTSNGTTVINTANTCEATYLVVASGDTAAKQKASKVAVLDCSKARVRLTFSDIRNIMTTESVDRMCDQFRNFVKPPGLVYASRVNLLQVFPANHSITFTVKHPSGDPSVYALNVATAADESTILLYTSVGVIRMAVYNITDPPEMDLSGVGPFLCDDDHYADEHTQISTYIPYQDNEAMPSGWRHITFSADIPYVVAAGVTGRTAVAHPSLYSFLALAASELSTSQVLQIEVNDIDSARLLFTAWFLPDRRCTVINVSGNNQELMYATSLRPMHRAYITRMQKLPRTSEFPPTDLSNFADNQVHSSYQAYIHRPRIYYPDSTRVYPNANLGPILAGAGGGWLSGVGQGLGQVAAAWQNSAEAAKNRDLTRELQRYDWAQRNAFNDQNWRYGLEAQGRGYGYQSRLLQQDYAQSQGLARQRQELAGYRTPGAQYALNATANSTTRGIEDYSGRVAPALPSNEKPAIQGIDASAPGPGINSSILNPLALSNSELSRNQPGRQRLVRKSPSSAMTSAPGPSGVRRPAPSGKTSAGLYKGPAITIGRMPGVSQA